MGEDPSGSTPISGSFFREQNCGQLYMSLYFESVAVLQQAECREG